jgi:hypothetical protein
MNALQRAQHTGTQIASLRTLLRCAPAAVAVLIALAGGVRAAPASAAGTPYVDGISDQNLGLWDGDYQDSSGLFSPVFDSFFADAWVGVPGSQHLQYARYVTAPDAVAQGGACESNLTQWFTYVTQTLHMIPVIAVWDVAEGGCANHGAPSPGVYASDISSLITYLDGLYPGTTMPYIEAWNEPNSSSVSAATAAAYWTAANSVCATAGCTAIAGDFVDNDPDQGGQSFNPGCTPGLTYNALANYEGQYVSALGGATPAIWGFHPYFAVNCEQSASVTTFEDNLPTPSGQVWFTEVAAWECIKGKASARGVTQQNADAQYLVNTLMAPSAPDPPAHVFYYEMAAPGYTLSCSKYSDSELYEAIASPGYLHPRPAAATIFGGDTTLAAATAAPSAVTSTQATFNGTLTPGGIYEASYYFLYGPTSSYGSQTPVVSLGPGLSSQPVSATVAGLTPGSAYHYQLVVTDANGAIVYGPDVVMAPVVVAASGASVTAGTPITVSWSGISNPSASDWIGLYQPGAPAGSSAGGFYADSCTTVAATAPAPAAGSCTFTMPATPGSYQLELYTGPGAGLLTSSSSITSLPPPPVESAAPLISGGSAAGRAFVGDRLSCSPGRWSNEPSTLTYTWASDGAAIAGASGQTYVVAAPELSQTLTCAVTASNAGGSSLPALSAAVAVVVPQPVSSAPPSISSAGTPAISGSAVVGERLRESHARWSNAPTSYSYQWQRCDRAGGHCHAIAGAKGSSYTLSAADVGSTIRVLETASNARAKSVAAPSHVTAVVTPPAPGTLLTATAVDAAHAGATFRFRASGRSTGFQCALVRRSPARGAKAAPPSYVACHTPASFTHLARGSYVFYVRAVGLGGPDRTPATYAFTLP